MSTDLDRTDLDTTRRETLRAMLDADCRVVLNSGIVLAGYDSTDDLPDGAHDDYTAPFAVVTTNNEGDRYIEWRHTLDGALECAHEHIMQPDKYAWWPEHIYDLDEQRRYGVRVEVSVVEVTA